MFWHRIERHGERIAFIEASRTIGYRALAAAADDFAAAPGELVLLELDQSIAAMTAYVGALRRGAPAIVINAGNDAAAARMVETFRPVWRWSPAAGLQRVAETGPSTHPDLAVMLSTSGTTGATKLVRLSASAVDANASAIVEYLQIDETQHTITTLPPGYSYGLSVLNSHLAAGASIVLNEASVVDPDFRRLIEQYQVSSFAGVPYTYELLERSGFFANVPPSIRVMTQAGGKLPAERARAIGVAAAAAGSRFFVMYGQTEATARMAYLPPDQLMDHADCIGRPIPGGRFDLVDPETGEPAADRGELVYSGPNVMMGYAEAATDLARGPELANLRTGDLAERTEEGLYRITGRKSRFLKLFGLRLSLEEIEAEAARNGWQVIAAGSDERLILGSTDPEAAAAAVYFSGRYDLPPASIAFVHLAEVPRLSSGKIDYQAIIAAAPGREDVLQGNVGDAQAALIALFERTFPGRKVSPGDSFLSMEGDSLSYISVSLAIEQITGALPDQWESLPIATLAEAEAPAHKANWARVEAGVLMRAVAPIMIVSNHAGVDVLRGGAVLLLMLAGQNFGRFSRANLAELRIGKILSALAINILIPFCLFVGAFELAKRKLAWADLALISNWTGYGGSEPFQLWFVQALAQAILLYIAITFIPAVRRSWSQNPFTISYILLLLAGVAAYCHYFFWQDLLDNAGRELTWQLWIFAAGVATNYAATMRRRAAVALVVLLVAVTLYGTDPQRLIASIGGVLLLLSWRKIPVPLLLLPAITLIGSSSFFIYMTHGRAPTNGPTADWAVDIVRIGLGIALGVAAWLLYEVGCRLFRWSLRKLGAGSVRRDRGGLEQSVA